MARVVISWLCFNFAFDSHSIIHREGGVLRVSIRGKIIPYPMAGPWYRITAGEFPEMPLDV